MGMVKKLLGFAIKANKIVYGTDNILIKKVYLIIFSADLGNAAKRKLKFEKSDVPLYCTSLPLSDMIRVSGCKVIGITDGQFAQALIKNFDSNYQRITVEDN